MSSLITMIGLAVRKIMGSRFLAAAHFMLGLSVILAPVMARADVVADGAAPANQRPTVLEAGNGVPVVNIRTPSSAGVSRNAYSEFNVDQQGVILNNGRTDSSTQLGGWVQANPWLATGSARVILNEVNASDPSRLNGYVEVAGSRAQVVVANPAGISCNGCGFINANRATLTTGTPILNNGRLEGYDVSRGSVTVGGAGLDNSGGYTDLIAQAVEVNAGIWSQGIAVAGGGGTVNAEVTQVTDNGSNAPAVAIDVAHLGGMYANSIRMIGNNAGVGVRNAGQIGIGVGEVVLTADGRIENSGVINGGDTQLNAQQLDNAASGRVYGDQVSIAVDAVSNIGNGETAPVIAARQHMNMGATTIDNREHGLIYSGGDMAIGGALDENRNATGRTDTLNNASATIEAAGDLQLSANRITNSDEHLQVENVLVDSRFVREYRGSGSNTRYSRSEVDFERRDQARDLRTPDDTYRVWYEYEYTRRTYETQVIEADPARIIAGGDIHLNTDQADNHNSHILAGGVLSGDVGNLNNHSVVFNTTHHDNGRVTRYRRYLEEDAGGTKDHWEQWEDRDPYRPADTVISIDRSLAVQQDGAAVGNTNRPDSSLFTVNPSAPGGYLIETDPQFADYRQWISSDYMLQQLAVDPALTQMRLGDGFYEQQLVREQMALLTGRRFMPGHGDDEAQYIALMDAGVTFAQDHNIRPGIALTAEQIAQLTSDIVWLVEEQRTLSDGSVANVLVPRLYVMVRENGINGSGGLIAAEELRLNLQGRLHNSGTMAANGVMAISADNLDNVRGTLNATDLQLSAANDINNTSGAFRARDNLSLNAGNDINIVTATNTQHSSQGTRVNIDRIAGLYVNSGSLQATAGHDINLTGAAIVNDSLVLDADRLGNTELIAGNNFILNSVQQRETQRIEWDSSGTLNTNITTQHGTRIDTAGDIRLQAGNNLDGTATRINSHQGATDITAANDVSFTAGINTYDESDHGSNFETLSAKRQHQLVEIGSATGTRINAGNNLTLTGADLSSQGATHLSAQGDTTISAVVDTDYRYSSYKDDRSYGRSETTTDETLASTVVGGNVGSGGDILINAHKNNAGDIITEQSGNVALAGTTLVSGGDIAIAGDGDVTISAIQTQHLDFHQTKTSGMGGLSKTDEGSARADTRLHNAQLASGGNTHVISGNNLSLIAADIMADGNINLEAVDQLLIAAGQTLTSVEQWKNESSAFSGGHLYEIREHSEGETIAATQASTLAAGGVVTTRSGTARIIGSDIHGEQGVDLQTDAGDITIEAAQTTRSSYVHDKEVTVSLGDAAADGIDDPSALIKTDDGRLTIKLAGAHFSESDTRNDTTEMRSSNISSGGDVNVVATAASVNIIGSNLASDTDGDNSGDINLSAAQNINIVEAIDTASSESKTTTGDADLSFVVQNQAVEVVKAVQRLEDAKEQLEESKRQYKDYERNLDQLEQQLSQLEKDFDNKKPGVKYDDIVELRALVDDVKDDEEWYQAGIALAAMNLVSATTALIQQTATAAASTATYGFNVGLQLDIDATKTRSEYLANTAVASNLSGQNIRIQTGNGNTQGTQTNIQGSQLQANDTLAITTGVLNVTASKNTVTTGNETEHGHITAQMTVYGAAGGASVNASFDRSKNSARETTYNNSVLLADTIELTTSGDTTLRGATVRAESELNADIAGNLTVESVQNRSASRNTSNGFSGGFSLGGDGTKNEGNEFTKHAQSSSDVGGLSGVNAGFSTGNGMSSTRQTVLTSLTSGGTANINVKKHTQITGALVATTDDNGNDLNQLNLSTDTLGFSDLRNSNISSQTSTAFSSNIGIGATAPGQPNTAENNTGSELLPGTSNLTYNNSQQNSASKQLATLGHGNVSVGGTTLELNGELTEAGKAEESALAGMNRDTVNTTKELWNSDYSQDVDVTLDHRLLTEDGHKAIAEDAERSKRLGSAILDVAQLETYELQDTLDHIAEVQTELDVQKAFALANDGKGIDAFQGAGVGIEDKQAAISTLAQIYTDTYGISIDNAMIIAANTIYSGTAYSLNGTTSIAINDNAQKNALDYANTMGHEVTHARIEQNATRNRYDHDLNEQYANNVGEYAASGMAFASYNYNNLLLTSDQNTNTHARVGNDNAILMANNRQWNAQRRQAENGIGVMDYRRLSRPETEMLERTRVAIQEDPNLGLVQKMAMELQVEAVYCASVRCADGVPPDDQKYQGLLNQQAIGDSLIAQGVTIESLSPKENLDGLFQYTWLDETNDYLTSTGDTLFRVQGGTDFLLGATGMAAGVGIAGLGAAGCAETGISCLLLPVGASFVSLGFEQGEQGLNQLFGSYTSSEGRAVTDSFYLSTHPGEKNLARDLAIDWGALVLLPGVAAVAERYLLTRLDDVSVMAREASGGANPNLRYGDGDDAELLTSLVNVDRNAYLSSQAILNSPFGKVTGNYSAINPGPLAANMAETFSGARYAAVVLDSDTTLFRAGTASQPLGQFFSVEKPIGIIQSRIDKAVLPVWPGGGASPLDTAFEVKIPAGSTVYVGDVGAQSGFYLGGTQQIVVVKPWANPDIKVLNSSPLQ